MADGDGAVGGGGGGGAEEVVALDRSHTGALNLAVLQRSDPAIEAIVASASHAAVYENRSNQEWVRLCVLFATATPASKTNMLVDRTPRARMSGHVSRLLLPLADEEEY